MNLPDTPGEARIFALVISKVFARVWHADGLQKLKGDDVSSRNCDLIQFYQMKK